MDLKNLSELTRVVIVDNVRVEGEAIQRTLGGNGIASYFHLFEDKTKIDRVKKMPNVRLVFLDLELDSDARSEKIKAGITFSCLKRIIEPNSYYVLVVWSNVLDNELCRRFLKILRTNGKDIYPCVAPIFLDKKDFHDKRYPKGDVFRYAKLRDAIDAKLSASHFFKLFSDWEVQISSTSSSFLSELLDSDNQLSISKKINSLADAYAGHQSSDNPSLLALLALNGSFKGALDSAINTKIDYAKSNRNVIEKVKVDDVKERARINRLLMINEDNRLGPGCVFIAKENYSRELYSKVSKATQSVRGIKRIKVDITPICDYANPNKTEFYTYLHGLAVPVGNMKKKTSGELQPLINNSPRFYELSRYFTHQRRQWNVVFDLTAVETIHVSSKSLQPKADDVWLKFREGIVIDLEHVSASHHSRPGHILLP